MKAREAAEAQVRVDRAEEEKQRAMEAGRYAEEQQRQADAAYQQALEEEMMRSTIAKEDRLRRGESRAAAWRSLQAGGRGMAGVLGSVARGAVPFLETAAGVAAKGTGAAGWRGAKGVGQAVDMTRGHAARFVHNARGSVAARLESLAQSRFKAQTEPKSGAPQPSPSVPVEPARPEINQGREATSTFNKIDNVENVLGPPLVHDPPAASVAPAREISREEMGYHTERFPNISFAEAWKLNEKQKAETKRLKDQRLQREADRKQKEAEQSDKEHWRRLGHAIPEMLERQRFERQLLRDIEYRDQQLSRPHALDRPPPLPLVQMQAAVGKRESSPEPYQSQLPDYSRVPGMRSMSRSISRAPTPATPGARDARVQFFP